MSTDKKPKRSLGNFQVITDYDLSDMPKDYEALILVGGMSWFNKEAELLVPIIKDAIDKGKIVGGICNASVFLGQHGFLNDVNHTSNGLDFLKEYAGEGYTNDQGYIHEQAVSDKNIVTANGTGHLEFSRELLLLLDADTPKIIEEYYDYFKKGYCEMTK